MERFTVHHNKDGLSEQTDDEVFTLSIKEMEGERTCRVSKHELFYQTTVSNKTIIIFNESFPGCAVHSARKDLCWRDNLSCAVSSCFKNQTGILKITLKKSFVHFKYPDIYQNIKPRIVNFPFHLSVFSLSFHSSYFVFFLSLSFALVFPSSPRQVNTPQLFPELCARCK